ncbi:MAG: translation initiation factor IF-2, partial [Deltaproteobacteria bacterium]|nr:translation initiation factor IF-2 [Deltaproteobacteria bacterium]
MKVYELARDLNIPGKDLIARMKTLGYEIKSNFNVLDEKTIADVKAKLLQPVTRVEEQHATPLDAVEGGDKPRKRRIISARKSGEVRKIQESMGVTGPLPADQRTREEMHAEEESPEPLTPAPSMEAPAVEPETSPVANLTEPAAAAAAGIQEPRGPRRVEGLPLPKPVDEKAVGQPVRVREQEDWKEVKSGERRRGPGKPTEDAPRGAGRPARRDKIAAPPTTPEEEWVRPRRSRSASRLRKQSRVAGEEPKHTFNPRQKAIRIAGMISVSELAGAIGVKASDIIRKLMGLDIMVGINDMIEGTMAELVAADYDIQVQVDTSNMEDLVREETINTAELESRPPIVTIMGHVDHGKTTLLDFIRSSHVAGGEAGGITQHIGAYYVASQAGDMTFLDTPGHEAFTTLRQRGADVTDLVVLIVAADDGVMPQTREAIDHAKAAKVPIIVAINKIDRPNADPGRIKQQLMEHGLLSEEFGGDTVFVPLSAKTGKGVDDLLEMIHLQAEMLNLRTTSQGLTRGHVIETRMDRRRGPVATVLVQRGTLRVGDHFVAGSVFGRVRALYNDQGARIEEALPSHPVEVLGYDNLPDAGDLFVAVGDEKSARQLAELRGRRKKELETQQKRRMHLEDFLANGMQQEEIRHLNIVLKADAQGSLEALQTSLLKEGNQSTMVQILRAGVGGITETDVALAATSDAVVIGFNVRAEVKAADLARSEGVEIKTYTIIYELINDVHDALVGLLKPITREEVVGHAEIKSVFSATKTSRIAGGIITDGKVERNSLVR